MRLRTRAGLYIENPRGLAMLSENRLFRAQIRIPANAPLEIADHRGDTSQLELLREVLVLTKMNWNSAAFCESSPITLRFSRQVGEILQEVPRDQEPRPQYAYYM